MEFEHGSMYKFSVIHEQGLVINSLQITYNNTDDITGNYVGLTWTDILPSMKMNVQLIITIYVDIDPFLIYRVHI